MAIVYAFTFDRVKAHVLGVRAFGRVRLPDITGIPDLVWLECRDFEAKG